MTKELQIADGTRQEITLGDKVELRDGREVTIQEFAKFGRLNATDANGANISVRPGDIVGIIKEVAEIADKALETIESAKGFWSWFSQTSVGTWLISKFKKNA